MAKRGTKPKPTPLHELHGTMDAELKAQRRHEPIAEGEIGAPPEHLTDDQKADWIFAVKHAPSGVLAACDQGVLEVFIVARDHHRIANRAQQQLDKDNALPLLTQTSVTVDKDGKKTGGGNIIASPYLGIISTAGKRMMSAAAELGFTPASRPRLSNGIYDPAMAPTRQPPAPGGKAAPPSRDPTGNDLDNLMGKRATLN